MKNLYLFFLKAVAFVVGHLPLGPSLALGRAMGSLGYRLAGKHQRIALENLDLAYGESLSRAEKEAVAREVFQSLGMLLFEFMRIPWLTEEKLSGYVEFSGLENLDKALKKKKGIILFTAHFGNWELLAATFGLHGYTLDVVARELDNPVIEEFVCWVRSRCGNRIVSKWRAMRKLIKSLSNNGIAGILLDQNVAFVEGVFADYFGIPACTNKGPALLAIGSGAAVVPAFIIRKGACHTIVIGEELPIVDTGDREADVRENTRRCTRVIEDMVRKHPGHWFWIHRRWKTRPEGDAIDLESDSD